MKVLVAISGASGACYAQRCIELLHRGGQEVHVLMSPWARVIMAQELETGCTLPSGVTVHDIKNMKMPFASGSTPADAMVVIPCSMGTLARIAHGMSDDLMMRCADVMLKERRKLIVVPRETPLNLIHVRNMEQLLLAGADIIPAIPSFYSRPQTVLEVVDSVVGRVLDHLGVSHELKVRYKADQEEP